MAYTDIDKPSDYFNTKLYTGTGSSNAVTGVGFEPSFTWIKNRDGTNFHNLYDVIRGATKTLDSATTAAESTSGSGLTAWGSDGFTVVSDGDVNASSNPYVSWNWVAGTSFTNDASATGIGSIDSTGSFNNDSGFSIVSYTGTGSAGTIKHGLNSAPSMIIVKKRNTTNNWDCFHASLGATKHIYLNATNAVMDNVNRWNDTAPTTSVFSVGDGGSVNASSDTYIAYCFAEKKGYSKFGKYIANANANGTFVYLGFKPAFLLIKNTSQETDWIMYDNKRDGYEPQNKEFAANSNAVEANAEDNNVQFCANGFKVRNTGTKTNADAGNTLIYMCFASNPLVTSTGVPATAR